MKKVSFQVQLTGRPYLTLKIAVAGRAVLQGWGRRVPLSCVQGVFRESPGIFIPFQRHGAQYLILRDPLLILMDS